jgi:hypothetical protein
MIPCPRAGNVKQVSFLKDLADKTQRGQRGRVEMGRSGGGSCYSYDLVCRIYAAGEPERGERSIDPVEAEVQRRYPHLGAALSADLVQQVVLVAGTGFGHCLSRYRAA